MKILKTVIWLSISASISASIGLAVAIYWEDIPFGLFSGALLSWPISLAITTGKRRWWAVATLFVNFLLTWKIEGLIGLLFVLICAGVTLFMSAAILRDLYGGSEIQAFLHHMKILTGLMKGIHIVSEGKTEIPPGDGPFMGPRQLIVKPNTAVIVEKGAKHTHTLGPGMLSTGSFEYVKHIFNLHPQMITFTMSNVRTRDLLTVTIEFTIVLAIGIPASIRTGAQSMNDPKDPNYAQYDKYRKRLQSIYDHHTDWEVAAKAEIESQVRRYSANLSLDELTDALHYQDLATTVVTQTNQRVNRWGIRVDRAIVERIEPTRSVAEKMEEQWADGLRMKTASNAERAQAQGLADALTIIALGYRDALAQGMSQDAINRLVLMRTLERIVAQPGINLHLSAVVISDVNALRQTLGLIP